MNKSKFPLVSVIITTKNEEKNIKTCLVSIKNQTYQNIEIIVVDNNSIDSTKKLASEYTKYVYNKGPESVKGSPSSAALIAFGMICVSGRCISPISPSKAPPEALK